MIMLGSSEEARIKDFKAIGKLPALQSISICGSYIGDGNWNNFIEGLQSAETLNSLSLRWREWINN